MAAGHARCSCAQFFVFGCFRSVLSVAAPLASSALSSVCNMSPSADRNPQKVLSDEVCTGANIFVEGTDPTLQPDEEYPEWLWELSKPMKSIKQIRQQVCCEPKPSPQPDMN